VMMLSLLLSGVGGEVVSAGVLVLCRRCCARKLLIGCATTHPFHCFVTSCCVPVMRLQGTGAAAEADSQEGGFLDAIVDMAARQVPVRNEA
jgi:hypothetical protein